MLEWEYCAIHLNDIPQSTTEIDVLNNAGDEGWELVGITTHKIAYLKRRREQRSGPVVRPAGKTAIRSAK